MCAAPLGQRSLSHERKGRVLRDNEMLGIIIIHITVHFTLTRYFIILIHDGYYVLLIVRER